jgi:hypothetical protein
LKPNKNCQIELTVEKRKIQREKILGHVYLPAAEHNAQGVGLHYLPAKRHPAQSHI